VTACEDPERKSWLRPADTGISTDDELDSISGGARFAMGGIESGPWPAAGQGLDDATLHDWTGPGAAA
jgi:hypothetical protein